MKRQNITVVAKDTNILPRSPLSAGICPEKVQISESAKTTTNIKFIHKRQTRKALWDSKYLQQWSHLVETLEC